MANFDVTKKVRLIKTKIGREGDFDKFKKLWKDLGIKIEVTREIEINLDFEEN